MGIMSGWGGDIRVRRWWQGEGWRQGEEVMSGWGWHQGEEWRQDEGWCRGVEETTRVRRWHQGKKISADIRTLRGMATCKPSPGTYISKTPAGSQHPRLTFSNVQNLSNFTESCSDKYGVGLREVGKKHGGGSLGLEFSVASPWERCCFWAFLLS